jgi:hypothetical protein
MEEFMNHEAQDLIEKANRIIQRTGSGPGVKYPSSLKKIISSLRNDHKLSIKEVITSIPISAFSAREWPRKSSINKFNEVKVKNSATKKVTYKKRKEFDAVIFNQRVLIILIIALIFQPLIVRLID